MRQTSPQAPPPVDVPERLRMKVAQAVAAELRPLYGDRLEKVLVFGSSARPDAHPESDIDLLVVLVEMTSPWEEHRHRDAILWRHTTASGITVSALPVSRSEFEGAKSPLLRNAKGEAVLVT